MSSRLQIIDSGSQLAAVHMERDRQLLAALSFNADPILHFYQWRKPCATYGIFSNPHSLFDEKALKKLNFELAKRPTGGGITFHFVDFSFSLLIPGKHPLFALTTLASYQQINNWVQRAIQPHLAPYMSEEGHLLDEEPLASLPSHRFFCMAKPTRYDLMIGLKKFGGCAQRRTKEGFLHQISLCLVPLPRKMLEALFGEQAKNKGDKEYREHAELIDALLENSFCLKETSPFETLKEKFKNSLAQSLI